MSISKSPSAYTDCYEAMDRALETKKGVRMLCESDSMARFFRMRCHSARSIRRRQNAAFYEIGHPQHGTCEYDAIQLRIREAPEGKAYLYFDLNKFLPGPIESLDDIDDDVDEELIIDYKPALQIEAPKLEIARTPLELVKRRV